MQAWKVHKFGGSSVADAACMQRVAEIIEGDPAPRKAVVLSACRGVTDALLNLVTLAEQQDAALDDRIETLRQRHIGIARELLAGDGSLWLHCDHRHAHHVRALLEEIFGAENYLNTITWRSQ